MLKITTITERYYQQVTEIFFESSGIKNFKSDQHKKDFLYKYLGYYFSNHADLFFVMLDDDKVQGYICGVLDSNQCKELFEIVSHYHIFRDLYDKFPAHLHLNTHYLSRGKGVGEKLINFFCNEISVSQGVHIITSSHARNVNFYEKNGFKKVEERLYTQNDLLFMGRRLRPL